MWFVMVLGVVCGGLRWFVVVCCISTDRIKMTLWPDARPYRSEYPWLGNSWTASCENLFARMQMMIVCALTDQRLFATYIVQSLNFLNT